MKKKFFCPCCGFRGLGSNSYLNLPKPPIGDLGDPPYHDRFGDYSHEGCHSCGYQFGYDDDVGACGMPISLAQYRDVWIASGCLWFCGDDPRPANWSLADQLSAAGIPLAPKNRRPDRS